MKRYTGQQALYEAISRSRAKTKRGGILERLLPELAKREKGPVAAGSPPAESKDAPVEPPTGKEPSRPVRQGLPTDDGVPKRDESRLGGPSALGDPERLYEAVAGGENAEPQRIEKVEETEMPAQEPAVLPGNADLGPKAPKPWAMEEADLPAPARRIGSPNAMNRARGALPMWWRLKPLQLNEGRVEISVSYHVAIAVALVVILVILAGFRLGQRHSGAKAEAGTETKAPARAASENTATGAGGAASPASGSAQPGGDNWIVLATHGNSADLEPVKEHFAKNGIALEICAVDVLRQSLSQNGLTAAGLPNGDGLFLLVTSGAYHNPQNPDTDGYRMKQKIASVGATYKAPKGRDPFTPRLFSDAYGMKISRIK